jgi:hypothetical protein
LLQIEIPTTLSFTSNILVVSYYFHIILILLPYIITSFLIKRLYQFLQYFICPFSILYFTSLISTESQPILMTDQEKLKAERDTIIWPKPYTLNQDRYRSCAGYSNITSVSKAKKVKGIYCNKFMDIYIEKIIKTR